MQNYIYIETYGCSANQNNSEILAGLLTQSGYQITTNLKIADIIIINTCIVKQKTENKIKRRIQDIARQNPGKLLIIAGCMPETDLKEIKKLSPKSLVLGTHNFKSIIKLLNDYKNSKLKSPENYIIKQNEEKILLPKISNNKLISIIQISEGCLGECTYCKTRLAKGKLFSYSEEKILKSIENDLNSGAKEIWLTSQDCASYGLDKNKNSKLPNLLKKILSLKHNFKLRLGMCNPNNFHPIQNEMMELFSSPKMYKFLHIPIQSASDKQLREMNRYYKINQAEDIILKFKSKLLDMTIATDIIIGYPSETARDFKENLLFINKFKPDVLNLSKFSLHKNTPIYNQIKQKKLNQIPIKEINKRTSEIMELHRKTALENKKKYQNQIVKAFINKKAQMQNIYEARDDNYNIILIKSSNKDVLGKTKQVKIKQTGVHHMIGEIV